jgi:hypothetical protein
MRGLAMWSRGKENWSGRFGGKTKDLAEGTREEKKNVFLFQMPL